MKDQVLCGKLLLIEAVWEGKGVYDDEDSLTKQGLKTEEDISVFVGEALRRYGFLLETIGCPLAEVGGGAKRKDLSREGSYELLRLSKLKKQNDPNGPIIRERAELHRRGRDDNPGGPREPVKQERGGGSRRKALGRRTDPQLRSQALITSILKHVQKGYSMDQGERWT